MAAMTCDRIRELAAGYVFGALEPSEMAAVREHLDRCRKPHPELAEFGGIVPYLAQAIAPVEPPASLKAAILAEAQSDLRARRRSDAAAERLVASIGSRTGTRPAQPTTASTSEAEAAGAATSPALAVGPESAAPVEVPLARPAGSPEPIALPARDDSEPARKPVAVGAEPTAPISIAAHRPRRRLVLELVAAAIAIVALGGLGVRVVQLQNDLDQATRQLQVAQQRLDDILFAPPGPGEQAIDMRSSAPGGPSGRVLLRSNQHLILHIARLAPTKGSEVYSLWLAPAGGTPTRLVSFTVDQSGIGDVADVGPVQLGSQPRLELTLDPNANASAPSANVVATGVPGQ